MSSFSRELKPKNDISEQCPRPCLRIGFLSGPATARQKRCHGAWFRTMRMFMAMMNPFPKDPCIAIYGNIYHQYTPNVSIYTIHGSYGIGIRGNYMDPRFSDKPKWLKMVEWRLIKSLLKGSSQLVSGLPHQSCTWANITCPTRLNGLTTHLRFLRWASKQYGFLLAAWGRYQANPVSMDKYGKVTAKHGCYDEK